jgi:transposase
MSNNTEKGGFMLKAYSPKEIRNLYGVSALTYRKWTESFKDEIGELKGKYYTVAQVKIIIDKLGAPGIVEL